MRRSNNKLPSKSVDADFHTSKLNRVVDTENEFAAEFGESLYGSQAREAFEQEQLRKKHAKNKQQ
ncbi:MULTISPECIES: hypothetical protein [Paenibacillus]|uniref:hypothetical protein n=1 Tax=Paenibacillus TaxID=44249 RepID=UPI00203F4429|nr:hypothetical protein [Paenibacillus camelliae]MCM3634877.1 hypothetical protein [Paenibacillus camelliae]